MKKIRVVANGHGPVPMFENARRYIGEDAVEVPANSYYLRRINHGELREVAETYETKPAAMIAGPRLDEQPMTTSRIPLEQLASHEEK